MSIPTFSIIIPAYKAEATLGTCISSVVAQNYPSESWEMIIVDDCSPDKSYYKTREIVESYAAKGFNVRLLHHNKNKRQGGARNTALRAATNDYVMFLDSDDCWVTADVLAKMAAAVKTTGADLIRAINYTYLNNSAFSLDKSIKYKHVKTFEKGREVYYTDKMMYTVCTSVYLRQFLLDNNLFFEENIFFEDTDWNVRMVYASGRSVYVDFPFYGYVDNPTSTTRLFNPRLLDDNLRSHAVLATFGQSIAKEDPQFGAAVARHVTRGLISAPRLARNFRLSDSIHIVKKYRALFESAVAVVGMSEKIKRVLLIYLPVVPIATIRILTVAKRSLRNLIKHN